MDLVPRLLGHSRLHAVLQALQPVLPAAMRETLNTTGNFMPMGMIYLLLGDSIKVIDSTADAAALDYTDAQLFSSVTALIHNRSAQDTFVLRCLRDHTLACYTDKLQEAVACVVPILFMGGSQSDYEAVPIKRISPAGQKCVD